MLRQEHLPADVLGPLVPDSVHLARTASRSVLGFMNDMVLHCRRQMEASCGLDFTDVEALNERLRRTLHDHDGYCEPIELVAQRLHARQSPRSPTKAYGTVLDIRDGSVWCRHPKPERPQDERPCPGGWRGCSGSIGVTDGDT